jgi:hypothetical protein
MTGPINMVTKDMLESQRRFFQPPSMMIVGGPPSNIDE